MVKQMKCSFTVFTALTITAITVSVSANGNYYTCDSEKLAQCIKPLSILTDFSFVSVQTKEELDSICSELFKSLSCIHGYTRRCMNFHQRKYFGKIYFNSVGDMVYDLCRNETYQEKFLSYGPCMHEAANETQMCYNEYSNITAHMNATQSATNEQEKFEETSNNHHDNLDETIYRNQKVKREVTEDSDKLVCCSLQEHYNCLTDTIESACSEDAALFFKRHLYKITHHLIDRCSVIIIDC